ncbi:MAG: hypothetical protein J6Y83_06615, partial [Bacteroidales bacterium]|nr:hypothetical protein [Bacteroidales bacterium]
MMIILDKDFDCLIDISFSDAFVLSNIYNPKILKGLRTYVYVSYIARQKRHPTGYLSFQQLSFFDRQLNDVGGDLLQPLESPFLGLSRGCYRRIDEHDATLLANTTDILQPHRMPRR